MARPIRKYSNPLIQAASDGIYSAVEEADALTKRMESTVKFLRRRTDTHIDNANVGVNVAASRGKLLRATKQGFIEIESA